MSGACCSDLLRLGAVEKRLFERSGMVRVHRVDALEVPREELADDPCIDAVTSETEESKRVGG